MRFHPCRSGGRLRVAHGVNRTVPAQPCRFRVVSSDDFRAMAPDQVGPYDALTSQPTKGVSVSRSSAAITRASWK